MTKTKHPESLFIFFSTEMWERFGFYIVQSLLTLYLATQLHWTDKHVYALVGSFTALTYLTPALGGWIADNLLGQKRSILLGIVVLFFSYIALAFNYSDWSLLASLAAIPVGTGLLKPNISSLLGNQYPIGSSQRENGFTIFYMGITTGIILGTTLPNVLNQLFGWGVTFGSGALSMVFAFSVFSLGIYYFKLEDYRSFPLRFKNTFQASIIIVFLWAASFIILSHPHFANLAFSFIVVGSLFYLILTIKNEFAPQRQQTAVIGLLCIISVLFWAFYFQIFLSITLFLHRVVEDSLLGITFPPPYYIALQSLGMLVFGYFLSRRQKTLDVKAPFHYALQTGIRTGNKFLLAMLCMLMAYGLITLVCQLSTGSNSLLSPWLFIPVFLFISIAELLLSPVGLSAITVLSSQERVSTMMGIFFVSLGIGAYLAGKLAELAIIDENKLSLQNLKLRYAHSFTHLFIILLLVTFFCVLLNVLIRFLLRQGRIATHRISDQV